MNRLLAGTSAALLLGASALATTGLYTSYAASTTKQEHYADALLWPAQGGLGNGGGTNGSTGAATVLWQSSNVPGGSFAILTGQGSNLNNGNS